MEIQPFKTILLLCEDSDRRSLSLILKRHRPTLKVTAVGSLAQLVALTPALLAQARLVSFASSVVVPGKILASLGYGAYNFHPGPPDYPGRHAESFALYEKAAVYGATAHVMYEKVDAGPIIDLEIFEIPDDVTLPIRLTQTPTTCWVRPIAGVEFSVGRRLSPARDPQQ